MHVLQPSTLLKNAVSDFKIPSSRDPNSYPNIFPMEIWEEIVIVSYDINPANLIRLNKAFCAMFAPEVYSELNLYLLISDIKNMRLNDGCFLKYGPDFLEDWPHIGSYALYERHQKSQHYGFEFLDVSKSPEEGNKDKFYNGLITNHKKFLCILDNILSNPKYGFSRILYRV